MSGVDHLKAMLSRCTLPPKVGRWQLFYDGKLVSYYDTDATFSSRMKAVQGLTKRFNVTKQDVEQLINEGLLEVKEIL